MSTIKIHIMHTGQVRVAQDLPFGGEHTNLLKASGLLTPASKKLWLPVSAYLIEHPKGLILVDTGCDTMPGFIMNKYILPDEALRSQGVSPNDITDVIITHSDHDHIDGVHHFKNAVIYIQEDEYIRGEAYIPKDFTVKTFKEKIKVADCIDVIKIGGHQKGSCIVEFNYNCTCNVIVGDECYSYYNIRNKIPTASTCNIKNSQAFIEKYANGYYELLLMHE